MRHSLDFLFGAATTDGRPMAVYLIELVPPAMLAAVTGLFAFWAFPPIRLATLESTAEFAPTVAPRALSDSNPRVRRRACQLLLESDSPGHFYELRDGLYRHPAVAASCLTEASSRHHSSRADDVAGRAEALAYGLSKSWTLAVSSDRRDLPFRACRAIGALRQLEEVRGTATDPLLLVISGSADSAQIRACAADEFRADALDDFPLAGHPFLERQFRRHLGGILRAAFPTPLGDSDASSSLPDDLPAGKYRRWVLRRSCRLLPDLEHQFEVLRAFQSLAGGRAEGGPPLGDEAFTSPDVWSRACERFRTVGAQAWNESPGDILRRNLRKAAVARAVATARYKTEVATRIDQGEVVESEVPRTATAPRREATLQPGWVRKRRQTRSLDTPIVGRMVDGLLP